MAPIPLHATTLGSTAQPPLVILHGLLGSGKNWASVAKLLAEDFCVHLLDLRNHGQSPTADPMHYAAMAEDVAAWAETHGVGEACLLGHSMGGKTAMAVACRAPAWLRSLVVVDIAPKTYAPRWRAEFAAMRALELDRLTSRAAAEAALEPTVPDWAFRKFLLTNLERRPTGGFQWSVDLARLEAALPALFAHALTEEECYPGPTLFLRGERSNFITEADAPRITHHFPAAQLETLPAAGHNLHFDQPQAFTTRLRQWKTEAENQRSEA